MRIAIQIFISLFLISCGNSSTNKQTNDWTGTKWEQLSQENIKLRIPNQLKRSSRYRIKEDLPKLAEDSIKLRIVQNSLKLLEFEDSEIDVFVDTTKTYRMLIICNTSKIDFSKTDVAILKKQLKLNNDQSQINEPSFQYGEISAKLKANQTHKLARYTTQIQNKIDNSKVYNSIYYLTGNSYTLVVYEFSEDEDSIEKYLWTTKT